MQTDYSVVQDSFRLNDAQDSLGRTPTVAELQALPKHGVYRYSSHAQKKRLREKTGVVDYVPRTFVRGSWKEIQASSEPNVFIITYAYNAVRDLTLVVNGLTCEVITLYCRPAANKPDGRGFFRLW